MTIEHPDSVDPAPAPEPTPTHPAPNGGGLPPFPTEGVATAPPRRRRARGFVIAGAAVVLAGLMAGGFWAWSAVARSDYDATAVRLADAQSDELDAVNAFGARMRSVDSVLARVHSVAAAPEFTADTAAEAEPFRAAIATLDAVTAESAPLRDVTPSTAASDSTAMQDAIDALDGRTDDEPYRAPWDLMAATEAAAADAREARDVSNSLNAANNAAAEAQDALDDQEEAYFEGLGARGTATIAANPLSTKSTQVDLTRWIERASNPNESSTRDGSFLASFAGAERAVSDSQARIAAELDDPALAVRHEIEAYARSLSNGITLDFVWAPEVSGLGEGWISGTAQTWDTDGGWAIISLNYPVEEDWTYDSNARALVAHEVGHTQVYRENCWPLFSGPVFQQDHEMWATAWSISQGFDIGGSGISAYGRPSDEQIAVAAQCR